MPIFNTSTAPVAKPTAPFIDTVASTTGQTGQLTVETTIEGTPWSGTWYSQYLRKDDEPKQLDFGVDPSLQEYIRINSMILMLPDESSLSFDSVNAISEITGEAKMYPGVTPNKGDHFIGKIADGRTVIVVIRDYSPFKLYSNTAYNVTYSFFAWYDDAHQREFDRKVIQTRTFKQSSSGCSGLVDETVLQTKTIINNIVKLVDSMYDQFYNKLTQTFIYPESNKLTYDPMLLEFWNAIIDRDLRGYRPAPLEYTIPTGTYRRTDRTIWNALRLFDPSLVKRIDRFTRVAGAAEYQSEYVMAGLVTSHVTDVIAPSKEPTLHSFNTLTNSDDMTYVFSRSFYEEMEDRMPVVEKQVWAAMRKAAVSRTDILKLAEDVYEYPLTEQFYLIPTIIWLHKVLYIQLTTGTA